MAWVSPKVYAILSSSEEGKDIIERLPDMTQDECSQELDEFFGEGGKGASQGKEYDQAKFDDQADEERYKAIGDEEVSEKDYEDDYDERLEPTAYKIFKEYGLNGENPDNDPKIEKVFRDFVSHKIDEDGLRKELQEIRANDFSRYSKNGWRMSRNEYGNLEYAPYDEHFGLSRDSYVDNANRSPEDFYKGLQERFGSDFDTRKRDRDDAFYKKYYYEVDEHNGYKLYQNPENRMFFIVAPNGEQFGDNRRADKKMNIAIWDNWKATGKYDPYFKKGK
jgi:hypothetical protein